MTPRHESLMNVCLWECEPTRSAHEKRSGSPARDGWNADRGDRHRGRSSRKEYRLPRPGFTSIVVLRWGQETAKSILRPRRKVGRLPALTGRFIFQWLSSTSSSSVTKETRQLLTSRAPGGDRMIDPVQRGSLLPASAARHSFIRVFCPGRELCSYARTAYSFICRLKAPE
jgi:hypothetical protein